MARGGPPVQPRWGRVIQERREARRWSIRWAAQQANMSDVFWAQMERGYKRDKAQGYIAVTPSLGSLLQAAAALRLDAREVDDLVQSAGYDPLPRRYAEGQRPVSVVEAIEHDPDLIEEARAHLLSQYELLRRLSDVGGSKEPERSLRAVARKRPPRKP